MGKLLPLLPQRIPELPLYLVQRVPQFGHFLIPSSISFLIPICKPTLNDLIKSKTLSLTFLQKDMSSNKNLSISEKFLTPLINGLLIFPNIYFYKI